MYRRTLTFKQNIQKSILQNKTALMKIQAYLDNTDIQLTLRKTINISYIIVLTELFRFYICKFADNLRKQLYLFFLIFTKIIQTTYSLSFMSSKYSEYIAHQDGKHEPVKYLNILYIKSSFSFQM